MVIDYLKELEENAQLFYWENVDAWGWLGDGFTQVEYAVKNLNLCGRADTSISILHGSIRKGMNSIKLELVIETLIQNIDNKPINAHYEYDVRELIKWLQERKTDKDSLIIIEWKYLAFLREDEGYPPVNLWEDLSSNPDHFMYILKILNGKERGSDWTDEDESKMIKHCYHLLESWTRTNDPIDVNDVLYRAGRFFKPYGKGT